VHERPFLCWLVLCWLALCWLALCWLAARWWHVIKVLLPEFL